MITLPASALASRESHWLPSVACKPTAEPLPRKYDSTIIHLNVAKRTADVMHNGKSRSYPLKMIDPFEYRRLLVNSRGYKHVWLNGDVCLLTKKVGGKLPSPSGLRRVA